MKRFLGIILCVLLLGLVLTSCSKNTGAKVSTSKPVETPTQTPTPTPTPTPTQTPTEALIAKYSGELKECKPELKGFCSELLNVIDNSGDWAYTDSNTDAQREASKIQNYLKRETVINYGKTKTGLETVNFKDGTPAFAFVNTDPTVIKYAREAVTEWQNDDPTFLDTITKNGMCVFYEYNFSKMNSGSASYDGTGVFLVNFNKDQVNESGEAGTVKTIRIHLGVETFGIAAERQGTVDDWTCTGVRGAFVKQMLAAENAKYLYIKTSKQFYADRVSGYLRHADDYCSKDSGGYSQFTKLLQKCKDANFITPFGANNWQEVDKVVAAGK